MIKYLAVITLSLLSSANAFAGFIYADDFTVGTDVTQLTDNVTLRWLSSGGNADPSSIHSSDRFYHQHFGGPNSSTTSSLMEDLWYEIHGGTGDYNYTALEINFATPVRSFGFKAENTTGSPFMIFLVNKSGEILSDFIILNVSDSGSIATDGLRIWDSTHSLVFNEDISKIMLGGSSDAGYIYALDVTPVPEPSSAVLLFIGLAYIFNLRRLATTQFI